MARSFDPHWEGPDWRIWPQQIQDALAGAGWRELYARPADAPFRLHLDVGFGRGEFVTDLARQDPESCFLGVERSYKRVVKVAKRLAKTELTNLRLIGADAEWVFEEALPPCSVATVWVNFPDPWPKRRHAGRRLLDGVFARRVAVALEPGGSFHFATDHAPYAVEVDGVLGAEPLLRNAHAPDRYRKERPETLATGYEREWREMGRECFYFHYRRVPGPRAPSQLDTDRAGS